MKLTRQIAEVVGRKLCIDFNKIPFEEFYAGMEDETEHKDVVDPLTPNDTSLADWVKYGMIAHTHLKENPNYYSNLKKIQGNPQDGANVEMAANSIKEAVKEIVFAEMRYPQKTIDFNHLPDADSFWGYSIKKAGQDAGVNTDFNKFRTISDIFMWLNAVAEYWQQRKNEVYNGQCGI